MSETQEQNEVEFEVVDEQSTALARHEDQPQPMVGLSLAPVETMQQVLPEYIERRNHFRGWLMDQLILGVHFGFPPGCEPRGNVNPDQWTSKPSLYKAGAELVNDLMMVRPRWFADPDAATMLGKSGVVCFRCELVSFTDANPFFPQFKSGMVMGEGRGTFELGEKKMNTNAQVKMAQKRANVDAVLNTFGLSDLFTQDWEENQRRAREAPPADNNAPKAASREQRGIIEDIKTIKDQWTATRPEDTPADVLKDDFVAWVEARTGIPADVALKPSSWTVEHVAACKAALAQMGGDS